MFKPTRNKPCCFMLLAQFCLQRRWPFFKTHFIVVIQVQRHNKSTVKSFSAFDPTPQGGAVDSHVAKYVAQGHTWCQRFEPGTFGFLTP